MLDFAPTHIPPEFAETWARELMLCVVAGWFSGCISLLLTGFRAKKRKSS